MTADDINDFCQRIFKQNFIKSGHINRSSSTMKFYILYLTDATEH